MIRKVGEIFGFFRPTALIKTETCCCLTSARQEVGSSFYNELIGIITFVKQTK
jgi:hypothetical protein